MGLENRNNTNNQVDLGAQRELGKLGFRPDMLAQAANNMDHFARQEMGELGDDLKSLRDSDINDPALSRLESDLQRGKIIDLASARRAREEAKQITLNQVRKGKQDTIDRDEDEVLGFTKGCMNHLSKMDLKGIATTCKSMKEAESDEKKHMKRIEKLKTTSPRGFKAYLKRVKEEKEMGSMQKSRKEILDDVEKTYKDVLKSPPSVQGEFFKRTEKGGIDKKNFKEVLQALETEYQGKLAKYLNQIDDKLFGKKPAMEFRKWIAGRKDFSGMDYAQQVLDNKYLPERRQAQKEFEALPQDVTAKYKDKWENELGYSERRALLDTFKKLEHQKDNPFAQEYLKNLTGNQKEIAPKEWDKMTEEFLTHSFEEQEALNKVFHITELKERKALTKRFEDLPNKTRDSNKNFFALDKQEKTVLLDALEKTVKNEDSASAWGKVIETEQGQQIYRDKLQQVMNTQEGEAVDIAGILAKQTLKYQQMTGKVSAQDRHEHKVRTEAGDQAADRVATLHEMSGGEKTVSERDGSAKDFHTIDLFDLENNRMERDEITQIKEELHHEGYTGKTEDAYTRVDFKMGESGKSLDLAKNSDQTGQLESMIQAKLIEALMMTIEAMSGKSVTREIQPSDEEMRKMLGIHQAMTKQKFHGLTSVVHEKMAA